MNKVYSDSSYRNWFRRSAKSQYIKDVYVKDVDAGIIAAGGGTFGVFDANQNFVKESFKTRGKAYQRIPKIKNKHIGYIDKEVIFIGGIHDHFGHFLLEQLSRVYAISDKKFCNRNIVFVNYKGIKQIPKFLYDFMALFGIEREKIIILDKTTQFRKVAVPVQGFDMYKFTSYEFGNVFDVVKRPRNVQHKKIYVSRVKMGDRKTLGEEKIQNIFAKNGFEIIYPETLSLADQAKIISSADVLAGCAGTALHLALFMKPGGTVIQIKRNRKNEDSGGTQNLINMAKGLNGIFVAGSVEPEKSKHYCDKPQIIGMTKYMQKFMDDFGIKYTNSDLKMKKGDIDEYWRLNNEYKSKNKHRVYKKVVSKLIMLVACIIPGRDNRAKFRSYMKLHLHAK